MTDFEKQIWASAFSAMMTKEYIQKTSWTSISWFHCAEMADLAVQEFRNLREDGDGQYLDIFHYE